MLLLFMVNLIRFLLNIFNLCFLPWPPHVPIPPMDLKPAVRTKVALIDLQSFHQYVKSEPLKETIHIR